MHDDSPAVRNRIRAFVNEHLRAATVRARSPLSVTAWAVPDEPVPFAEAVSHTFEPFAIGSAWGRPWSTTWFHVTGEVPAGWDRAEVRVDLGFGGLLPGFQAEGLAFTPAGTIIKGIEPRNTYVPLTDSTIDFYVEAAANPEVGGVWTFQPTPLGDKLTAGDTPLYVLRAVEVVAPDAEVTRLLAEVEILSAVLDEWSVLFPRGAEILRALERVIDTMDPDDIAGTAAAGRAILRPLLDKPAGASAHRITAVGHSHIDSAWLWPTRETVRKLGRTFANVLHLMDIDPSFVFVASAAQHYAWVKQAYPELYARVRERVAEGRFVPVGGMWVESDTNLPGGEALARQFVAGQTFFQREFGRLATEVWLPDTFGYTAALPQLAASAGLTALLTQKISWNDTNTFPHHTFHWEGIDGTRLLTHFPPVNTYNADLTVPELLRAERTFAEKGRATSSLVPFGIGDGGGGPTREMLDNASLLADLEGVPPVTIDTPRSFFDAAAAEYADPPVWSGELYLEFHRGTYTSQARVKRGNRRSEHLLREAELWATQAFLRAGLDYPYDELERAWHTVLLNQFHDILPGSAIAWVYREAQAQHAALAQTLESLIARSLAALATPGPPAATMQSCLANAGPFARAGVPGGGVGPWPSPAAASSASASPVPASIVDGRFVLVNGAARVTIDASGRVVSAVHLTSGRDLVPPGCFLGELQLFRDKPRSWDAWDLDVTYRRSQVSLDAPTSVTLDADAVVVTHAVGDSRITLRLSLVEGEPVLRIATEVDWHERHRLLKLAFPLDLQTDRAAAEIQFGHLWRPITTNTSWDVARFEISAQRWVYVAEGGPGQPGFGAAVANDATYGHDITRVPRAGGGVYTLVRQSLLRAPTFPDPEADQGEHRFATTLTLGASLPDAIRAGYELNLPVTPRPSAPVAPLIVVDHPAILVEAVKLAEDRSGDVIVRLYESVGVRCSGAVSFGFPVASVVETDLLERAVPTPGAWSGERLTLRPFQIVTLRLRTVAAE